MRCGVIDGSVVCGSEQPLLFNFVVDKPPGFEVFRDPETIHKKVNESDLNTITCQLKMMTTKTLVLIKKH